jgi:Protein of unknown function (DUF4240)
VLDFWGVIGRTSLRDADSVRKSLAGITIRLSAASPIELVLFDDCLREACFRLDREDLASFPVTLSNGDQRPQTSDHFLYARCACILAGLTEYNKCLQSPSEFEPYVAIRLQSAESLLHVAYEVYESMTGRRMKSRSEFPVEWMSNSQGWV